MMMMMDFDKVIDINGYHYQQNFINPLCNPNTKSAPVLATTPPRLDAERTAAAAQPVKAV
jgi:hypothetical protein